MHRTQKGEILIIQRTQLQVAEFLIMLSAAFHIYTLQQPKMSMGMIFLPGKMLQQM